MYCKKISNVFMGVSVVLVTTITVCFTDINECISITPTGRECVVLSPFHRYRTEVAG